MRRGNWFALSWPLMWECFKMYWYIPALSFVLYFFIGVFPLLSHISERRHCRLLYTEFAEQRESDICGDALRSAYSGGAAGHGLSSQRT